MLGDITTTVRTWPVAVNMTGILNRKIVTAIAAGYQFTVALTSDGKLYAWGYNSDGQFGDGTTTNQLYPVAVNMSGVLNGKTIAAIACGALHTVAIASDGTEYAWGWNYYGELGDGTTMDRFYPVTVNMAGVLNGKTITNINCGEQHTVAIASDSKLYAWGDNQNSQLGDGTNNNRNVPIAVYSIGVLNGKNIKEHYCYCFWYSSRSCY